MKWQEYIISLSGQEYLTPVIHNKMNSIKREKNVYGQDIEEGRTKPNNINSGIFFPWCN